MDQTFHFTKYNESMKATFLREINLKDASAKKLLVWDPPMRELIGMIIDSKYIENETTSSINLSSLEKHDDDFSAIIFILQPHVHILDKITSYIELRDSSHKPKVEYRFIFVPRVTQVCRESLKDLLTNVEQGISSLPLYLYPSSPYVLSMERENAFRDIFLEQDNTVLFDVSCALMELQRVYGPVGDIYGKGLRAESVVNMMKVQRESELPRTVIDGLILFERPSDFISSLMTQLTYEGVIHECVNVSRGRAEFDDQRFARQGKPETHRQILMDHKDVIFREITGKSLNAVGQILSSRSRELNEDYEKGMSHNLAQMKEFTSRLESVIDLKTSLATHIAIAEILTDFVNDSKFRDQISLEQEFVRADGIDKMKNAMEDAIIRGDDFSRILRLVCLQCVCNGGFDNKLLQDYKRELIQSYGFGEAFITLTNLQKVGLLSPAGKKRQTILALCPPVEDVDEVNPSDPCYVFAIFAPLISRLAPAICRNRSLELLKALPGPTVLYSQTPGQSTWLKRTDSIMSLTSRRSNVADTKVFLVFFLGGVTQAEIDALRFLSAQSSGCEYVIATTNIITGTKLINSLAEPLEFSI